MIILFIHIFIELNWQKTRYVYDMYYTYHKISKQVYDYCIINKIIDNGLITKWKKPGYERLCSTYVINPRNYKYGTVSICRVPKQFLAPNTEIEDPTTGCRGCASGNNTNIFKNKYGQYLAAIQIAREEKLAYNKKKLDDFRKKDKVNSRNSDDDDDYDNDDDDDDDDDDDNDENDNRDEEDMGPVGAPDGSSGPKKHIVWAANDQEEAQVELTPTMIGELGPEAKREAMTAALKLGPFVVNDNNNSSSSSSNNNNNNSSSSNVISGPPGKRSKPNNNQ